MAARGAFIKARGNPFAVARLDALGWIMPEAEWAALGERLRSLGGRGAIIGPHGSGKTAMLSALAARLRSEGRAVRALRLNRDRRPEGRFKLEQFLSGVRPGDCVLLDGAEQLGFFAWRRFLRRVRQAAGLIITSHRAGRLPCLAELAPAAATLSRVVARLTNMPAAAAEPLAARYFERHHGNLREALRAMYDDYPFAAAAVFGADCSCGKKPPAF